MNREGVRAQQFGTFSGKPMGSEEFLIRMLEALGTIVDRRPEERPRKMEAMP